MDRAQASRLVAKLRALAADRAATDAEKALAHAKADELGVAEEARSQARRRYRARRVWAESPDLGWIFAASRNKQSPAGKAEHHWGDWKITIEVGWQTEPIRVSRSVRSRRAI